MRRGMRSGRQLSSVSKLAVHCAYFITYQQANGGAIAYSLAAARARFSDAVRCAAATPFKPAAPAPHSSFVSARFMFRGVFHKATSGPTATNGSCAESALTPCQSRPVQV